MYKPKRAMTEKKAIKVIELARCYAKTIKGNIGEIPKLGISIYYHCLFTGLVAREIVSRYPKKLQKKFFPAGFELCVASHDVGKVWDIFQTKIYKTAGIDLNMGLIDLEEEIGYHSTVGMAAVKGLGKRIQAVIGRHHGSFIKSCEDPDSEIYGGKEWQKKREELLTILAQKMDVKWPDITTDTICNLLTGLTCVSDWISSGNFIEQKEEYDDENYCLIKVKEAVDKAGFIKPELKSSLSFQDIFGFSPNSIQKTLFQNIGGGKLFIIEAPMGKGKTESALYAAYKLLLEGDYTGIYFALPTQLTSNRIYDRFNSFLKKILVPESMNKYPLLLHGTAWLLSTEMGEKGEPGNSWFNTGKRGLLAPFAVGTIDQALLSVLNVKHYFVRSLGLMGKIVILDEIHSYDMYTNTIIDDLIRLLQEIGCIVILLSATLTVERRKALLWDSDIEIQNNYPLISKKFEDKKIITHIPEYTDNNEVKVHYCSYIQEAYNEVLKRVNQKQQILWIENTVDDAQYVFTVLKKLTKNLDIEIGLIHSRFIKKDRKVAEDYWVEIYGKEGAEKRVQKGRVLVGTQVLEQSLDIDADFLVTQISPSDFLIQRIGRLWRHEILNKIRPIEAVREVYVLAPQVDKVLKDVNHFEKTANVYDLYTLYRTLEIWSKINEVNIPNSIPIIIEQTYHNREEKGVLKEYKNNLQYKVSKRENRAKIGLTKIWKSLPEEYIGTRYEEYETVDMLILKEIKEKNDKVTAIKFIDDSIVDIPSQECLNKYIKKKIAVELLKNIVTVPEWLAPSTSLNEASWLKNFIYIGNDEKSSLVRIGLFSYDSSIGNHTLKNNCNISKYCVYYKKTLGFYKTKRI